MGKSEDRASRRSAVLRAAKRKSRGVDALFAKRLASGMQDRQHEWTPGACDSHVSTVPEFVLLTSL